MRTYLLHFWDVVRSSYWFVPSLLAVGALMLSFGLPRVDEVVVQSDVELPGWILTTTDTARATLSAVAGAMIAVTGTVFSITIVTLSLTSQQFGPRLLRRFMYDLTTQITLGVFLSTGFYCLLVLRVVESRNDGLVAPHLSVLMAIVLSVLSAILLIVFIHHVATLIQAPNVVAAVASDLDDAIDRLFPERIGKPLGDEASRKENARNQQSELGDKNVCVRAIKEGYIQAVATSNLIEFAVRNNIVVRILLRPGNFIAIDSPLTEVWFVDKDSDTQRNIEDLTTSLNAHFIVGNRRTPRQDVECAINELVEVALRALSPGINDPLLSVFPPLSP